MSIHQVKGRSIPQAPQVVGSAALSGIPAIIPPSGASVTQPKPFNPNQGYQHPSSMHNNQHRYSASPSPPPRAYPQHQPPPPHQSPMPHQRALPSRAPSPPYHHHRHHAQPPPPPPQHYNPPPPQPPPPPPQIPTPHITPVQELTRSGVTSEGYKYTQAVDPEWDIVAAFRNQYPELFGGSRTSPGGGGYRRHSMPASAHSPSPVNNRRYSHSATQRAPAPSPPPPPPPPQQQQPPPQNYGGYPNQGYPQQQQQAQTYQQPQQQYQQPPNQQTYTAPPQQYQQPPQQQGYQQPAGGYNQAQLPPPQQAPTYAQQGQPMYSSNTVTNQPQQQPVYQQQYQPPVQPPQQAGTYTNQQGYAQPGQVPAALPAASAPTFQNPVAPGQAAQLAPPPNQVPQPLTQPVPVGTGGPATVTNTPQGGATQVTVNNPTGASQVVSGVPIASGQTDDGSSYTTLSPTDWNLQDAFKSQYPHLFGQDGNVISSVQSISNPAPIPGAQPQVQVVQGNAQVPQTVPGGAPAAPATIPQGQPQLVQQPGTQQVLAAPAAPVAGSVQQIQWQQPVATAVGQQVFQQAAVPQQAVAPQQAAQPQTSVMAAVPAQPPAADAGVPAAVPAAVPAQPPSPPTQLTLQPPPASP